MDGECRVMLPFRRSHLLIPLAARNRTPLTTFSAAYGFQQCSTLLSLHRVQLVSKNPDDPLVGWLLERCAQLNDSLAPLRPFSTS